MWSNSNQRSNECILCNLTFNDDASLRKHFFEMHSASQGVSSMNNEKTLKNSNGVGCRDSDINSAGCSRLITDSSSASSSSSIGAQYKNSRIDSCLTITGVPTATGAVEHYQVNQNILNQHQIDLFTLQQILTAHQARGPPQASQRLMQQSAGIPAQNQNQQHNFGANGLQLAQQLILARAALNPQTLLSANLAGPSASPYSYLMSAAAAANFSPFYLSLNNLLASGNGLLVNDILLPQRINSPQNFTEPQNFGQDAVASAAKQQSTTTTTTNNNKIIDPPSAMSTPGSSSMESSTLGSPNERRTTSVIMSPEEVEQRISMLIAQNEAVLEPSPVLSKRRSYTSRQQHHGSLDYTNVVAASPPSRSLTTGRGFRSQSLVETSSPPLASLQFQAMQTIDPMLESCNRQPKSCIDTDNCNRQAKSCTDAASSSQSAMNVLNFHALVENETLQAKNYNCKFCDLSLRHLDEMKRHEEKCARREDASKTSTVLKSEKCSENKFPLKKRISAAAKAASALDAHQQTLAPILRVGEAIHEQKLTINEQKLEPTIVVIDAPRFVASDPLLNQIPNVSLSSSEQTGTFHPYCVTVKVPGALSLEPTRAGRKAHQVTQPTNSSSLRRISMSVDAKNASQYTNWSQIQVSPLESKLNIMMMDGCTMRSQRPYLNYTVAQKDLNLMRMTHSSYWTFSKKFNQFSPMTPSISPPATATIVERSSTPITVELCKSPDESKPYAEIVADEDENEKAMKSSVATTTTSTSFSKELLKNILTANNNHSGVKKITVCNGGYKTNEAYTYVRGRGRGRYVCARCGIRCKKPSMLKKHIRTHLNVRPYSCLQCMFSFKTKGNLTKHLKSKSHSKKCASLQPDDDVNGFRNEHNNGTGEDDTDETLSEDEFENMSDDEMDTMAQQVWQHGTDPTNELRRRTFSFKNIWNRVRTGLYFERQIRTPPLDVLSPVDETWDRCDSAPPSLAVESTSFDIYSNDKKNNNSTFFNDHSTSNGKNSSSSDFSHVLSSASASFLSCNFFSSIENSSTMPTKIYINSSMSEGKTQCEICGKEFVKLGLLRLHMAAHMFEQSSRRYDYKCPFCNSCFRSKNLLQKHLLHAHPQQTSSNASSTTTASATIVRVKSPVSTASQQQLVSPTPSSASASSLSSAQNPRPFECNDCNIAFRIHGHLAKHLRSKSHIMKLECLEKVPIGTFAKLEESNCDYFADIDTSDSHNSLKSLIKLAQRLMNGVGLENASSSTVTPRPSTTPSPTPIQNGFMLKQQKATTPSSSFVCTEELTPSPTPPPTVPTFAVNRKSSESNKNTTFFDTNGTKTVVADVWMPPKENSTGDKQTTNFKEPTMATTTNNYYDGVVLDRRNENFTDSSSETTKNLSASTVGGEFKCKFCLALFPSSSEIDLHWHADHVFIRDGKNFKCPKANCDTVYPSKRDLRNHLISHYNGTLDNDAGYGMSSNDVSRSTVVALSKKIATSVGVSNSNSSETCGLGEKFRNNLVKLKFTKNANDSSATASASLDNSPISDSDASRASISSQSVSPVGGVERQNLKRHSFEDSSKSSMTPSKRLAMNADDLQRSSSSRNTMTPTLTPNAVHHNANQSPVAVPVPIVPQRPNVVPSVWNSFMNVVGGPASPQAAAYLSAAGGHNSAAVSLLGLQHHPAAFLAASKLFNGWTPNGVNHPTIQLLATASPHLLSGGVQMPPLQESVFSIENLRCILCQKQCYTPMSLQEHLMSHNQPRLHVCKFCDAAFTTAQALQAHTPCRMQKN